MRLCLDAAMCPVYLTRSRLTEERALSRRQLMLVHSPFLRWLARPLLPKGWTASGFKTAGEVDVQRVELRTLGTRLAVVSILSFLCKSASVAASYFARDAIANSAQLESVIFLATALAVQAVPSAMTLLLLGRFHFSRGSDGSDGSGALMQSLLTRDGVSVAMASDSEAAAARQGQQARDHAAEVSRLQAEVQQLRAKGEQLEQSHRKVQETNQKLEQSHRKVQETNQMLEQANQMLLEEITQLRLDAARISQQVTSLMCCVRARACAIALTFCCSSSSSSSSSSRHPRCSMSLPCCE
jgi:hypothetical protein